VRKNAMKLSVPLPYESAEAINDCDSDEFRAEHPQWEVHLFRIGPRIYASAVGEIWVLEDRAAARVLHETN
jgi:hypothetical protein